MINYQLPLEQKIYSYSECLKKIKIGFIAPKKFNLNSDFRESEFIAFLWQDNITFQKQLV